MKRGVVDLEESFEGDRSWRFAWLTFAAASLLALPAIVIANRDQWFYNDDLVFAFARRLGDPTSLLRPHFGHLTALPAAAFQVIYGVVGLHSYRPYLVLVALTHLAVAASLLAVMHRCEVDGRIAASGVVLFLFFGSGRENLVWAFQITLNGSLAAGLLALAITDRDVVRGRRELVGVLLLCVGVLCSNLGPFLAVLAGLVALIRRGWRSAARLVALPLGLFAIWTVTAPPGIDAVSAASFPDAVRWGTRSFAYGYQSLTHLFPVAVVMFLVVARAIWGEVRDGRDGGGWRVRPLPMVLVLGTVALAASLGHSRGGFWYGPDTPRYAYLTVAFTLPVVAWALSRLCAGRPILVGVACLAFLVGLPVNVSRIGPSNAYDQGHLGRPDLLVALAEFTAANHPPPGRAVSGRVTTDQLLHAHDSGVLPRLRLGPRVRDEAALLVSLAPAQDGTPTPTPCRQFDPSRPVRLRRGQRLVVDAALVGGSLAGSKGPVVTWAAQGNANSVHLDVLVGPTTVMVHVDPSARPQVCGPG